MGQRFQLDGSFDRGRYAAIGVQKDLIAREHGAFDLGVFPRCRRICCMGLGTGAVGPVVQHRFGPLKGPVLPGNGHHLDRAASPLGIRVTESEHVRKSGTVSYFVWPVSGSRLPRMGWLDEIGK